MSSLASRWSATTPSATTPPPSSHRLKSNSKQQLQFSPIKVSAIAAPPQRNQCPTTTFHANLPSGPGDEKQFIDRCLSEMLNCRAQESHQPAGCSYTASSSGKASQASGLEQVHARVVKLGLVADMEINNKLVILYSKALSNTCAVRMLDGITEQSVPLYASLIGSCVRARDWQSAIFLFVSMIGENLQPDKFLLPKVLKAVSELGEKATGAALHGYLIKNASRLEVDTFIGNSLIDMYANCGNLYSSKAVFDTMPERDVVSWTALMAAYCNAGLVDKAFELFQNMKGKGVVPDLISWNALISGFSRDGDIDTALDLLEEMKEQGLTPGVNTWNGIISGCVQCGCFEDALYLFLQMLQVETPNAVTIASILPACSAMNLLSLGKGLHALAIKSNFKSNVYVCGSLIDMYFKCGKSEAAENIFQNTRTKTATIWNEMIASYANGGRLKDSLELIKLMLKDELRPDVITFNTVLTAVARSSQNEEIYTWLSEMCKSGMKPNVVSLNTLVAGFQKCGRNVEALQLIRTMQFPEKFVKNQSHNDTGGLAQLFNIVICPNAVTITSALSACSDLKYKMQGKEIHGYALRHCLETNVFVSTALIDMYLKCEDMKSAIHVFHEIKEKNVVTWNTLMAGYNAVGKHEAALNLLHQVLEQGVDPTPITLIILLSACGSTAALDVGRGLHCYIIKFGFEVSHLLTALIDMYAKCGCISEARLVFDCAVDKDLGLWNAMILCYSRHGLVEDTVHLFDKMTHSNITPDHVTFSAILTLCYKAGLQEKGWEYFNSMNVVFGVTPTLEHFTCMVGIMGDAGLLEEAMNFIQGMPYEPDACLWATLLRSCRMYSNYKIGEMAAKALFELEPNNTSNYIILSNIYAMAGMWDAAIDLRATMMARGLRVVKACSWINVRNTIHAFPAGDSSNPELENILKVWKNLTSEMKNEGSVPQNPIFSDEVDADPFSCFHTEKLAICYGIISLPIQAPILVSKNIRMCADCHTSAKCISRILGRQVLVNDGCSYHHFKNGVCSCNDKW